MMFDGKDLQPAGNVTSGCGPDFLFSLNDPQSRLGTGPAVVQTKRACTVTGALQGSKTFTR